MTDITLTRSGELMIVQVLGNTEAGIDFIDAWPYSDNADEMVVHDAGHIFVQEDTARKIETAAVAAGLTVNHDLIASEVSA